MPVTFRYPNLVSLGGVDLTDEGRQPVNENRDERSVTVELASGKIRKFVKGVHKKWEISWENVAKDSSRTIDGKGGRDEIRSLAQGGATLAFVFRDANGDENYTVFVSDYNENITMRRGDDSRFRVTLSLEEQG